MPDGSVDLIRIAVRVAMAGPGPVTVSESGHGPFRQDDKGWLCDVTVSGTVGGVPYALKGFVRLYPEAEYDVDEDGPHAWVEPGVSDLDFSTPEFTLAGVKHGPGTLPADAAEALEDILTAREFWKGEAALSKAVGEDFVEELGDEVGAEAADAREYARDPHAYHGVKRSDFY